MVSHYNAFAHIWHRRMGQSTPEELMEVYALGKSLGAKRDVFETAICFPGAWETGPQRELFNFELK
jgi:hypothetical protein